jgi:ABC-type sugar transport system ATPase subunit
VFISLFLADVFEVADRITVLRLGRYVGTYDARSVGREQLVGLMTGAVAGAGERAAGPPADSAPPKPAADATPS